MKTTNVAKGSLATTDKSLIDKLVKYNVIWRENFLCVSSPQETKQVTDPRMPWERALSAVK